MRCSGRSLATAAVCLGLLTLHGWEEPAAHAAGLHIGGGGFHFGGGHFGGGHFGGGHFGGGHIGGGSFGGSHIGSLSTGSMHFNGGNGAISGFSPRASSFSNVHAFSAHSNLGSGLGKTSFSGTHGLSTATKVSTSSGLTTGGHHAVGLLSHTGTGTASSNTFMARHGSLSHLNTGSHSSFANSIQHVSAQTKGWSGLHHGTGQKGFGYEHMFSNWNHGVLLPRGYNWGQNLITNGLYYRYWPRYCGIYNGYGYFGWPNLVAWGLYNLGGYCGSYGGYGGYAGYCGGFNYGLMPATAQVGYGYAGAAYDLPPGSAVAFADPNSSLAANGTTPATQGLAAANNTATTKGGTRDLENARIFAEKGENEFRAKDYKAAVYSWKHALTDDPKNGVLTLMLAQGFLAIGQYSEAAGATQQGMQLLPPEEWGVVVKNFKELYGSGPDYVNQIKALEKGLEAKPNDPAMRFLIGYQYGYLGYPKFAVDQLDKCLQAAPRDEMAKRLRDEMARQLPPQPAVPAK
jgi:tetratricopeptide (TPR) repeat protein